MDHPGAHWTTIVIGTTMHMYRPTPCLPHSTYHLPHELPSYPTLIICTTIPTSPVEPPRATLVSWTTLYHPVNWTVMHHPCLLNYNYLYLWSVAWQWTCTSMIWTLLILVHVGIWWPIEPVDQQVTWLCNRPIKSHHEIIGLYIIFLVIQVYVRRIVWGACVCVCNACEIISDS